MKSREIVYKAAAADKEIEKTLGIFDSMQKAVAECDKCGERYLKYYVDRINFTVSNIFDREELVAVKLHEKDWLYSQNECED